MRKQSTVHRCGFDEFFNFLIQNLFILGNDKTFGIKKIKKSNNWWFFNALARGPEPTNQLCLIRCFNFSLSTVPLRNFFFKLELLAQQNQISQ